MDFARTLFAQLSNYADEKGRVAFVRTGNRHSSSAEMSLAVQYVEFDFGERGLLIRIEQIAGESLKQIGQDPRNGPTVQMYSILRKTD